jgi:hypothetical protein
MAWNLHLVGTDLKDELEEVLNDFISNLEAIGHKLTGATLTTDEGQKPLPTAPTDPEPVATIGGEPVVTPVVPVDTPPSLPDAPVVA